MGRTRSGFEQDLPTRASLTKCQQCRACYIRHSMSIHLRRHNDLYKNEVYALHRTRQIRLLPGYQHRIRSNQRKSCLQQKGQQPSPRLTWCNAPRGAKRPESRISVSGTTEFDICMYINRQLYVAKIIYTSVVVHLLFHGFYRQAHVNDQLVMLPASSVTHRAFTSPTVSLSPA